MTHMLHDVVYLIIGINIGFFLSIKYIKWMQKKENDKVIKEVEDKYKLIFENLDKLKFKHRIHNFIHFKFEKWMVVYTLDKKELNIFQKDTCLAISTQVPEKYPQQIISFIEENYNEDINNVINVNGYNITPSYIEKLQKGNSDVEKIKKQNKIKLSLDGILDKINQSGINSLTEKEKEFLNNYNG